MFNKSDYRKNQYMIGDGYKKKGYDWWWHSFTGVDSITMEEKQFFIEFFIINPYNKNVVLGQEKEGNKPSYLMIKCGCWGNDKIQLNRFIPLKDVIINKKPISISGEDFYMSNSILKGNVSVQNYKKGYMSDLGTMSFDLKINKKIAFNVGYGTCSLFRLIHAFEMYWHAEGIKALFSGNITLNGKDYIISKEKSYGYQDKNWGSNFTSPWVWLSSCDLYSITNKKQLENSAFDIGGGKPKVFGISLSRKLLSAFYYEGKCYEYNFSKFWHPSHTTFSFTEKEDVNVWIIVSTDRKTKMELEISANKNDMLFINYEDPLGNKRFSRLWNGGNGKGILKLYTKEKKEYKLIDNIKVNHCGCEYGEFDK